MKIKLSKYTLKQDNFVLYNTHFAPATYKLQTPLHFTTKKVFFIIFKKNSRITEMHRKARIS